MKGGIEALRIAKCGPLRLEWIEAGDSDDQRGECAEESLHQGQDHCLYNL